jgi:hypothetical protein
MLRLFIIITNLEHLSIRNLKIKWCLAQKSGFLTIRGGEEELDGRAVSALGVRSWKLSTSLNGQSKDG